MKSISCSRQRGGVGTSCSAVSKEVRWFDAAAALYFGAGPARPLQDKHTETVWLQWSVAAFERASTGKEALLVANYCMSRLKQIKFLHETMAVNQNAA